MAETFVMTYLAIGATISVAFVLMCYLHRELIETLLRDEGTSLQFCVAVPLLFGLFLVAWPLLFLERASGRR
jgi:cellobiose-specific phosphotransferase system component IIC